MVRPCLALLPLLALATACPAASPDGDDESGAMESAAESSSSSDVEDHEFDTSSAADEGHSTDPESTGAPGSTGDPTGDATGDPTGDVAAECECVSASDEFLELTCDVDEDCYPIEVACDTMPVADCPFETLTVLNPDALACHREALIAGTPSMLRWELPYFADPGTRGQRAFVIVREGRRAITWHEAWGVPAYRFSDTAVSDLRDAAYFEACTTGTPEEQFRCLFDATQDVDTVCVDAYEFPLG